jgi:hypothetical protein
MSDDFVANPGSGGETFAADRVAGKLYPRSKLVHGDDGVNDGDVSHANPFPVTVKDVLVAMLRKLETISNPINIDPVSGRMRVVLDPLGGAQTLGTVTNVTTVATVTAVTTVATVTNVNNIVAFGPSSAGISAAALVYDTMHAAWANSVRPRIT